jgi:hypothetical protein
MIFAQFFKQSAIDQNKIIEACGDRAVIVLDGRCSRAWMGQVAAIECKKRGFSHWQIMRGENFLRGVTPISQRWPVISDDVDNSPSWLSAHGM